ncbi:MAG: ACT domain-containing protein [Planctomycetota bacterium]
MRIAKHLSVMLPNKPGQLASVADKLARAGVNIEYVYGSAGLGAQEVVCVFGVSDMAKAKKLIK